MEALCSAIKANNSEDSGFSGSSDGRYLFGLGTLESATHIVSRRDL